MGYGHVESAGKWEDKRDQNLAEDDVRDKAGEACHRRSEPSSEVCVKS